MTDTRKPIAQGDVIFVPVPEIPEDALSRPEKPDAEHGAYVVAHSETGHHHVVDSCPEISMFSGMDQFRSFLRVGTEKPVTVRHLRETHTHEPLDLEPGAWMIVRQRTQAEDLSWTMAVD